jgi:hypothetical protein
MLGWIYYGATAGSLLLIAGLLYLDRPVRGTPACKYRRLYPQLARGETGADVPYVHRGDEVGRIARR